MKSNRRSVLIGLGALTVGGGAVFGTGAFSSVEADRTVSVTTTGDGSALLQLVLNDGEFNGLDDVGGDQIEFDFTQLNENGTTTFDGALTVGNNGSESVTFEINSAPDVLTFSTDTESDLSTGSINLDPLESGGSEEDINITVDLTDDSSDVSDETVTFEANRTE